MKYLAAILIALALVWPFSLKPWPEMQLTLFPIIALLWIYSFAFQKIFKLSSLSQIKGNKKGEVQLSVISFIGTLIIGPAFVFQIFPWVEQCVVKKQLMMPIPLVPIVLILVVIPISLYGMKLVSLNIIKTKNWSNQ